MLIPCSYGAEIADQEWSVIGRIATPQAIWQRLTEIEEIKPVYDVCKSDLENLLATDRPVIPASARVEDTFYFAIGTRKGRSESECFVWVNGADKKTRFIGTFPSLFQFINPAFRSYREKSGEKPDEMELPQSLLKLDDKSLLYIKFLNETLLSQVRGALEKELMRSDLDLVSQCRENARKLTRLLRKGNAPDNAADAIKCPLGGSYCVNDSGKKYVCNHVVKTMDYRKTPLEGVAREALALVECLENISDIELRITDDSANTAIEISYNDEARNASKKLFEMSPEIKWFNDLHKYDRLSPTDSMHLAINLDLIGFFETLRKIDPMYDYLAGKQPAEVLPEGLAMLSISGGFDPFMRRIPEVSLSLGMTAEKIAILRSMLQDFQIRFSEYELLGRGLEFFEIPEFVRAFNADSDVDQRIFILPSDLDRVKICSGEKSARRQIDLDCGETHAVSLWHDIDVPIKFAMAFRADVTAMAFLKVLNQMRFENEMRDCYCKTTEWRRNNNGADEKIKESRVIPDDLKKCCVRDGLILDERYGYVTCAVHQSRNIRSIENQFYQANIVSGRWLRIYVRQDKGKSRLVVDLAKAAEVE